MGGRFDKARRGSGLVVDKGESVDVVIIFPPIPGGTVPIPRLGKATFRFGKLGRLVNIGGAVISPGAVLLMAALANDTVKGSFNGEGNNGTPTEPGVNGPVTEVVVVLSPRSPSSFGRPEGMLLMAGALGAERGTIGLEGRLARRTGVTFLSISCLWIGIRCRYP